MSLRVPPRLKDATLESLNRVQFKPVFDYASQYKTHAKKGVGLLLAGPEGIGKSWASVALLRQVERYYHRKGVFFDYEFVTAYDMFDRIPVFDSDGGEVDERRQKTWFRTYCTIPYLVLNDLGKELRTGKLHEQVVYKLGRVLRERSEKMLITHVTTNLPLKAPTKDTDTLPKVYGASIGSLLSEMTKSYHLQGEDLRKKR